MEPTNSDRAEWARQAVEAFPAQADDLETTIKDLFCNLMHLCNQENFEFNTLLEGARMHFEAEIEEDV